MRLSAAPGGSKGRLRRFLAALPVAVGSLVIAAVNVGVGATIIAVVVGVPIFFRLAGVLARSARRRLVRRSTESGLVLSALASVDGRAGVVRLSRASLDWKSRRGSDGPIVLPIEAIGSAELAPINAVFIKAA